MEAKKDIGKAIREKLDSLDRQPSDALWDNINKDLDKKKKRNFLFFWFYICSSILIGITVAAFALSNLSAPESTVTTIHTQPDSQINPSHTSGSPAVTSVENQLGDENIASGGSSPKGTAAHQNKNDESITNTDAVKNNTTTKNNVSKNSGIRNSESPTTVETATSQKNNDQKNNTATGSSNKQQGQYPENTTVANSKNGKTGNSKKNVPSTAATVADKNASPSGKENSRTKNSGKSQNSEKDPAAVATTASKNTSASGKENLKSNDLGNAVVSNTTNPKTSEQKQDATQENKIGNSSESKNTAITTATNTEIATKEGIPAMGHDSLPESELMPEDSLKAEVPKEEVAAEEKTEKKKDSLKPRIFKKFSVFAFAGPSNFKFPDSTIKTDSTTASVNTSNTYRYGVLFGYRLNHKLSIRTGFSLYNLKQSAKDLKLNYHMAVSVGSVIDIGIAPPPNFTWIDYITWVSNGSAIDALDVTDDSYKAVINIDRELSYLEIPLEISYNLFDRRFGLNVFGGGSMLLLNKNEVTAYNEYGKLLLGEWNAAAKTSFTGTLGLGLHYKFTPFLQLNAEPVFNYYFDTYNDSKPYSFTIRVGLQYNFDF